jgi:hypothetical protein
MSPLFYGDKKTGMCHGVYMHYQALQCITIQYISYCCQASRKHEQTVKLVYCFISIIIFIISPKLKMLQSATYPLLLCPACVQYIPCVLSYVPVYLCHCSRVLLYCTFVLLEFFACVLLICVVYHPSFFCPNSFLFSSAFPCIS